MLLLQAAFGQRAIKRVSIRIHVNEAIFFIHQVHCTALSK